MQSFVSCNATISLKPFHNVAYNMLDAPCVLNFLLDLPLPTNKRNQQIEICAFDIDLIVVVIIFIIVVVLD